MYHALGVCWIITFPLHYRSNLKMIKRIHTASITAALVLPAIPALLPLVIGGYSPYYSPPQFCSGRHFEVTYYTFLLPAVIILTVKLFALMLVFCIILRVC